MRLRINQIRQTPECYPSDNPVPGYTYLPGHLTVDFELELELENRKEQLEEFFSAIESIPSLKVLNKDDLLPSKPSKERLEQLKKDQQLINNMITEIKETGQVTINDSVFPLEHYKARFLDILMAQRRWIRQAIFASHNK